MRLSTRYAAYIPKCTGHFAAVGIYLILNPDHTPQGFEEALLTKHLTIVSATVPPHVTATFEMDIKPMYGSRMGNAQGGAIALIHDMCTTMAMAPFSTKDFWLFGGVSRVLSTTYLRPTKVGMRVVIECEVLQIGARFGMFFLAYGWMGNISDHVLLLLLQRPSSRP